MQNCDVLFNLVY